MSRPSTSSTHLPIAPTVPPSIHLLAAPAPTLIDSQLPSYLLPPVLDLLRESSAHVVRRKLAQEDELRAEGLIPPIVHGHAGDKGKGREDKIVSEELAQRVERIGLQVGGYIAEKLTLARPPLASHLDIIKFICKDLFLYVYSKQIDNLRTNHRGIFVLQSHAFPPLIPLSTAHGPAADIEAAKPHFLFPQALIQGALARLGLHAIVTAESSGLPQCTFQIRTIKAPGAPGSSTAGPNTPSVGGTPNPNPTVAPANTGAAQAQAQGRSGPPQVNTGAGSTGLGIAGASAQALQQSSSV